MLRELWDWIKTFAIAIVLVVLIRSFLFGNYVVYGESMVPNFDNRERLIVNKIIYQLREPKRGEVVVLHAPEGEDYIKRVIALPGERVRVQGDDVFINGEKLDEPYIEEQVRRAKEAGGVYNTRGDFPHDGSEAVVPEGHVFVMGDNRPHSKDSRDPSVGFIPFEDIVGRADLVYWPIHHFELLPSQ
jgi:signal peptidase I